MNERACSPRSRTERPSRFLRGLHHLAKGEGGTALVEFALVLLPLALIIFGGIDFGFVFKDFISVRQGVSDAAREAAVGQFGSYPNGCNLIGGPANGTPTANLMCTVHSLMGLDSSQTRVAIDIGDNGSGDQNKFAGPNDTGGPQPITICVQYQLHSVTGMLKPLINQSVATSTATEMIEVSGVSPAPATATETTFQAWPANSPCTNGPPPA